ncbi:MAG: hypothetical protein AB9915_02155 [Candidatus Dojkabacteria bacterium]
MAPTLQESEAALAGYERAVFVNECDDYVKESLLPFEKIFLDRLGLFPEWKEIKNRGERDGNTYKEIKELGDSLFAPIIVEDAQWTGIRWEVTQDQPYIYWNMSCEVDTTNIPERLKKSLDTLREEGHFSQNANYEYWEGGKKTNKEGFQTVFMFSYDDITLSLRLYCSTNSSKRDTAWYKKMLGAVIINDFIHRFKSRSK